MVCVFTKDGKAEIFLHVTPCRRKHLQERLEQLGAAGEAIFIYSFPVNDTRKLASRFFGRVLQMAFSSSGSKLLVRGSTALLPTFMYRTKYEFLSL